MKKILLSVIALATLQISMAQDAADKKFQAGLVAGTGLNFQNMGTKHVEKNGVGSDFLIGGNLNYMFNESIGLTTGIEFDFSKTKFKSGPNQLYYYFDDSKIIGFEDRSTAKGIFKMTERSQKSTYLTVPTMLLFRTKYIGYIRYFGKFGMRHSFLLSQKSNDLGQAYTITPTGLPVESAGTTGQENMKASNEVWFYKGSIGIAGGAEWNFSGSTCLVAELGYYYGITPLYYNRNNAYLFYNDATTMTQVAVSNKATQGQLQLKVSILF